MTDGGYQLRALVLGLIAGAAVLACLIFAGRLIFSYVSGGPTQQKRARRTHRS